MKKMWNMPYIYALDDIGDDTDTGGGTGQEGTDIIALDFDDWVSEYGNPSSTVNDSYAWWMSVGFDYDDWVDVNGDLPWPGAEVPEP